MLVVMIKKNNLILIKLKNSMKKMIKIAFVAAFVAIAGYGVYTNQKSETLSDLTLANVEALAGGESGGYYCCSPYSYECYRIVGGGIVHGLRLPLPC